MPLTFQDRESAFEAKYAHDQDLSFRVTARRDKLFARWVSIRQHLLPEEADRLHHAVLAVADGPQHDDDLLALAHRVVGERQNEMSTADLAAGLTACAVQAWEQLVEAPAPHLAVKGHV